MTVTTARVSDGLQTLIDARLDTIDRMLLGRVPRMDRLAIVREVEGQIHDLLAERGGEEPDRDDVLAVLARLDPPEAYLPEEDEGTPPVVRVPTAPRATRPGREPVPTVSRASGIVGLCALGLFLLAPVLFGVALFFESEILLFGGIFGAAGVSLITGLVAIALAIYARLRGAWAVVGLVTGLVSALLSVMGSVVLLILA
jgi:hypothetical protein